MSRPNAVLTATTPSLDGWEIVEYLGAVSAHALAGPRQARAIYDLPSDADDGALAAFRERLEAMDAAAVGHLEERAAALGANCIVDLRLARTEMAGFGDPVLLVTAQGTAARAIPVVPEEIEEAEPVPLPQVHWKELQALEVRRRVVAQIADGTFALTPQTWRFIIENGVEEAALAVLDATDADALQEQFFTRLPRHAARRWLYEAYLSHTGGQLAASWRMIHALHLLDLEEAERLIASDHFEMRRRGLHLLRTERESYGLGDLAAMERILAALRKETPLYGEIFTRKGMLGGARTAYRCRCSEVRDRLDVRCIRCQRDQHGFSTHDNTPALAIPFLEHRISVLRERLAEEAVVLPASDVPATIHEARAETPSTTPAVPLAAVTAAAVPHLATSPEPSDADDLASAFDEIEPLPPI